MHNSDDHADSVAWSYQHIVELKKLHHLLVSFSLILMVYLWPFPYFAYFCDVSSLHLNMYLVSSVLTYSKEFGWCYQPQSFSDIAGLCNRTVITETFYSWCNKDMELIVTTADPLF